MGSTNALSRTRSLRSVAAATVASAGTFMLATGALLLGAGPAMAETTICHATNSDSNAYNVVTVGDSAGGPRGHSPHNEEWKRDGSWHGVAHKAGDSKPEYELGAVGVPDQLADFIVWCETLGVPAGPDGDDTGGDDTGGDDTGGDDTGGDDGGPSDGGGGTPAGGGTDSPTNAVPLEPTWTEPTCTTPADVVYRSVDGVGYRTEGDVAPGKRVVVRSQALDGYSFADGTVTWWAHTFDRPLRCDGGDTDGGGDGGNDDGDPIVGGQPSPTVKGVQKFRPPAGTGDNAQPGTGGPHAVPTAVAAGLTDLSGGHGSPSTLSSPQLAQALVAGGLLLLVVGGGLGLGRRTNGAHEF